MILKIEITHSDGSVSYVDNIADIRKIGLALPKGLNWKKTSGTEAIRNKYFLLLTELAKQVNSGYTKTTLHEALKPITMGKFKDFPNYYTNSKPELSTKHLSHAGWVALIEELKVAALDTFGYTLT